MTSNQNNLSKREIEVVRLLAEGLASKQIGVKLNISRLTVDKHRRNIITRTKCKNTTELVVKCLRSGIID